MLSNAARNILLDMKGRLSAGWIQGKLKNSEGVCLYGALVKSAGLQSSLGFCSGAIQGRSEVGFGRRYVLNAPSREVTNAFSRTLGVPRNELALWNDAPERTVDDIIKLIDNILAADAKWTIPKGV